MPDKLLRRPAVEDLTGLSRSSIYNLMEQREFPRPVRLSVRRVAWRESEVVDWLASRQPTVAGLSIPSEEDTSTKPQIVNVQQRGTLKATDTELEN